MEISLKKATKKLLDRPEIKNIEQLVEEVKKLSGSKWNNKQIKKQIEKLLIENYDYSDYLIKENGKLCKKAFLFAKTKFKIKLTEKEIEEKQLIIGHRFIPFISNNTLLKDIILFDSKGKKIKQKKQNIHFSEVEIYFSFYDLAQITYLQDIEGESVITSCFDLNQWFDENEFTAYDYIQIQVVDFYKNEFKIEKIKSRDYNTQKLVFDKRDTELENAIIEIIQTEETPSVVYQLLFYAYAEFNRETITETGSPLSIFINTSEKFNLENISGIPFLIKEGTTAHERFAEMEIPEAGKSKDLNGIFRELAYSFSENFVIALIIQQIKTKGKIDIDKIISIILKSEYDFINQKQAENFEKAFNKVLKNTIKKWTNIKINKNVFWLLEISIDIQKNTNRLLRATDKFLSANPNLVDSFDYSILDPYRPIEMSAEEMITFIIENKAKIPEKDAKKIAEQLANVLEDIEFEINEIIESFS